MKPKDLKPFFCFEQRRPCLSDHIFYVPVYYQNYDCFKLPSFCDYFGNDLPVNIEYCSGNGDWIVEKSQQQPHKNWIAVEKRFDRVQKIWSKIKNYSLTNVLIIAGEALTFSKHYLPNCCIEQVYINFPDPWPKAKHAKKRLIHPCFLNELARILQHGKKLTFVTDDRNYADQAAALLCGHADFCPEFPPPYFQINIDGYGGSWFEQLWKAKGRQIHYLQYRKQ
jgi:tRNA (guanine-N7-)-methyltransferase